MGADYNTFQAARQIFFMAFFSAYLDKLINVKATLRWPMLVGGAVFEPATPVEAGDVHFTSFDVMSMVIMKPLVPLYSNALSPTR